MAQGTAKDAEVLDLLTYMVRDITPEHDLKLRELFRVINNKITAPINPGNEKIIISRRFLIRQNTCTIMSVPL